MIKENEDIHEIKEGHIEQKADFFFKKNQIPIIEMTCVH